MKIRELLKSEIVSRNTIIEVREKNKHVAGYSRVADGYKDDEEVMKYGDFDISEFNYKSYPEGFEIFIKS